MSVHRSVVHTQAHHIGDGVYASFDPAGVRLTTGSHDAMAASDVIYLEEDVLFGLLQWLERNEELAPLLIALKYRKESS